MIDKEHIVMLIGGKIWDYLKKKILLFPVEFELTPFDVAIKPAVYPFVLATAMFEAIVYMLIKILIL